MELGDRGALAARPDCSDPEYFRRLRVYPERQTIFWPNEADIAPETLYAHARRRATAAA